MITREQFQLDLEEIKDQIISLAESTGVALFNSVEALYNRDLLFAEEIRENDILIDREEIDINNKVILLIAKQQPVATDLRRLITNLQITNDLERMGDSAKNIAKITMFLGENNGIKIHPGIRIMCDGALEMLESVIEAFRNEDISIAKRFSLMDDKVDDTYENIVKEMLAGMPVYSEEVNYMMQMAFTAKYIERYADHITNIGESILFLIKGKTYNLS